MSHGNLPRGVVAAVTFDRMLEALSHRYRRRLLVALHDRDPGDDERQETVDVFRELDPPPGSRDETLLKIELIHNHLPKLEDFGFIAWDQGTGEITRGPNWAAIEPLLELLDDHADEFPDDVL